MEKNHKNLAPFLLASTVLFIMGCATNRAGPDVRKKVDTQMMSALSDIRTNYQIIAALEQANKLPKNEPRPNDPVLYQPLTIYNTPSTLETLVDKVADTIGYKSKRRGRKPAVDIVIFANYKDESAYNILKDIGAQAGSSIIIRIDSKVKTIIVEYNRR